MVPVVCLVVLASTSVDDEDDEAESNARPGTEAPRICCEEARERRARRGRHPFLIWSEPLLTVQHSLVMWT